MSGESSNLTENHSEPSPISFLKVPAKWDGGSGKTRMERTHSRYSKCGGICGVLQGFKASTRTFEVQQGLLANGICTPANLRARSTISDIVGQDLQFTWKKLSVHPAESLTHENHEKDIGDGLM